jgi:hypothetical protein
MHYPDDGSGCEQAVSPIDGGHQEVDRPEHVALGAEAPRMAMVVPVLRSVACKARWTGLRGSGLVEVDELCFELVGEPVFLAASLLALAVAVASGLLAPVPNASDVAADGSVGVVLDAEVGGLARDLVSRSQRRLVALDRCLRSSLARTLSRREPGLQRIAWW